MVEYQEWFEVVQEAATAKGARREQRGNLTSELADYWNENKRELEAMSKRDARELAREIVSV